jgi:hypothetical protein
MIKQDIILKNTTFNIKDSKISGNGVFSTKDILKGQTICFLEGEICTIDEIIIRIDNGKENLADPLQINDDKYIDLEETPRTFNHSCNPNAFIRGNNELVAIKNIKTGEEITYDYSTTMNDNEDKKNKELVMWTCKCNCGADNCRKIISQFKTLPEKTRDFYIKNKFLPDFMLRKFG